MPLVKQRLQWKHPAILFAITNDREAYISFSFYFSNYGSMVQVKL